MRLASLHQTSFSSPILNYLQYFAVGGKGLQIHEEIIMKAIKFMHLLALVLILAIFSGCGGQTNENNQHSKQIKDLQDQLVLQKQKTTTAFIRISSNPIGLSAFENFLLTSDKLFNEIVDVAYSECIKECAGITNSENKKQCQADCSRHDPFPGLQ